MTASSGVTDNAGGVGPAGSGRSTPLTEMGLGMRLVVVGADGRMGRMLVRAVAQAEGCTLSAAIERAGSPALGQDAGTLAGLPALDVPVTDDPLAAFAAGIDYPPQADRGQWNDWTPFTYPFNLTRQPAASVPCGFTKAGLPVGLQIVGPVLGDQRVLRAARAFEQIQPFRMPEL